MIVIDTVSGALSAVPSLTISCAMYVPRRSAVNDGAAEVVLTSVAVEPDGTEVNDQR
jgi:hypothetical protein